MKPASVVRPLLQLAFSFVASTGLNSKSVVLRVVPKMLLINVQFKILGRLIDDHAYGIGRCAIIVSEQWLVCVQTESYPSGCYTRTTLDQAGRSKHRRLK